MTARRQATVSSKVTGKVIEVLIEEGLHVKEGQVLARLDNSNVKASLELARAQLNSTKTALNELEVQVRQAEREYKRIAALAENRIADQSALDRAEAELGIWKARLDRQRVDISTSAREVAVWEQQLEDTIIRAPFSGVVTSKNAQPGEMISPISAGGGFTRTGIGTIVDMDSLEIEVDVNESYINRVQPKQPVGATLDAYPDWKIPCQVIAIIPAADRQKATVKVRVAFDKLDPRILPDMGVKVAFQDSSNAGDSAPLLVVPKSALRKRDGRDSVFVVSSGRVESRAITVAETHDQEVNVRAGVSAGEKIVIESPPELKDGDRILEKKP